MFLLFIGFMLGAVLSTLYFIIVVLYGLLLFIYKLLFSGLSGSKKTNYSMDINMPLDIEADQELKIYISVFDARRRKLHSEYQWIWFDGESTYDMSIDMGVDIKKGQKLDVKMVVYNTKSKRLGDYTRCIYW